MKPIAITCIVGARPNFMKIAPLAHALQNRPAFQMTLIHTGQHYSPEMSDQFFEDLQIPRPDLSLEVSAGTQTEQTAHIMVRLEKVFLERRPDVVLVVGDVTSTLATALVAAKLGIRLAHVEAGLRSFDRRMPEEINRVVTDTLSDFLFVTERSGLENLQREGIAESRVFFTGNVMIDTLLRFLDKAKSSNVIETLGLQSGTYAVATLHRPSNVDELSNLRRLLVMLRELSSDLPVVFPVHPRTSKQILAGGIQLGDVITTAPLGYLDFLRLTSMARLVLTDSGGIQEETTILKVPCLTMRENTERPVTVEEGTNILVGTDPQAVLAEARRVLRGEVREGRIPQLWDGRAAERIVSILEEKLGGQAESAATSDS
jgi:UDP-N-acetylglucosamine 2-epimerase (non-hydrolysing)